MGCWGLCVHTLFIPVRVSLRKCVGAGGAGHPSAHWVRARCCKYLHTVMLTTEKPWYIDCPSSTCMQSLTDTVHMQKNELRDELWVLRMVAAVRLHNRFSTCFCLLLSSQILKLFCPPKITKHNTHLSMQPSNHRVQQAGPNLNVPDDKSSRVMCPVLYVERSKPELHKVFRLTVPCQKVKNKCNHFCIFFSYYWVYFTE